MFLTLLLTVASYSQLNAASTCDDSTPELCICDSDEWTLIGSTCYLISEYKVNWTTASDDNILDRSSARLGGIAITQDHLGMAVTSSKSMECYFQNAQLVEIYDETEEAVLIEEAKARPDSYFWIALQDIATEGAFTWTSGASVEYTDWISGQPDNYDSNEDCIHMYWTSDKNGWNDWGCSNTCGFICEKKGSYLVDYLYSKWAKLEAECAAR